MNLVLTEEERAVMNTLFFNNSPLDVSYIKGVCDAIVASRKDRENPIIDHGPKQLGTDNTELNAKKMADFLVRMRNSFDEKRSDVVDAIDDFFKGVAVLSPCTEKRFIKASVPGTGIRVAYDTFTTKIMYHSSLHQWEDCVEYDYSDE
jgi:hypothetical protein